MKATQFIKDHGVEKARVVVEGAPESGQPLYFNTVNGVYLFTGYRNTYFISGVWGTEDDHPEMLGQDFKCLSLTHLKHLVESVDLVKKVGGIENAKTFDEYSIYCVAHWTDLEGLQVAIKDHESIYGGGDEAN